MSCLGLCPPLVVQGDVRKRRKVLVFCGSVDSCRAVEHHCQEQDLPTVCYHGDMPIASRKESMAAFAGEEGRWQEQGDISASAV